MITVDEAQALAQVLAAQTDADHSDVLEAVAQVADLPDWATFVAAAGTQPDAVAKQRVIPILRMFDHVLAREFYCDYLGFEWEWDHLYEPDLPVYAQVTRAGAVLHLTEHHGDATPGSGVMVVVPDLAAYRTCLLAKSHRNSRPGLQQNPWGQTMTILDPFGNRITFWQRS